MRILVLCRQGRVSKILCIVLNVNDVREGGGAVRKEWGRGEKNAVKLPSVRRGGFYGVFRMSR